MYDQLRYYATMHLLTISPDQIFSALADATRIRILRLLVTTNDEACLCDLADSLEEPVYKLSRHLKVLRQVGLLSAEKDGKWIYHRVTQDTPVMKSLHRLIGELPDTDQTFQSDESRFLKLKNARKRERCRQGDGKVKSPGRRGEMDRPRASSLR